MTDLLLFNPPRYSNGTHHRFNNSLLWLASYVHRRGLEARIVPLNDDKFEETVETEIARNQPKNVAISCKWWDTLYSSTYIAALVKRCDPNIRVAAGGHTATFFAKELVTHTDFDVVIRGDAEEPLYRLVAGQEPLNCVFEDGERGFSPDHRYVQTAENIQESYLVEDLESLVSDSRVLGGFVWTGKGCRESCVHCAGNAWNSAQSFGRSGYVWRPLQPVLNDIQILGRYPSVGHRVLLDFEPPPGAVQGEMPFALFSALSGEKQMCYYCSWYLPEKRLIDALAETFHFVEVCIDVQTGSERLRRILGEKRFSKPYFSDRALEETLTHCDQHDNMVIDLSTLMGLPLEQESDLDAIKEFGDHFYERFDNVRYPYVSPMNVEPGSLLLRSPERYGMVLMRKSFEDFLRYTQRSFERNINCYQPKTYEGGIFHPLGVLPKDDFDRGDLFRVYEAWKELQAYIDRQSVKKRGIHLQKIKKYGLKKIGVLGGVDHPACARTEGE
jgi:radical SAM superfamily enzyme YgiQ (UPF0313 family)